MKLCIFKIIASSLPSVAQKAQAITVSIPQEMYEYIECEVGEDCSFATVGEFANAAMHFFFDRLIVFLSEYNRMLNEKIQSDRDSAFGGTKLGLIYRYLFTDRDWNYGDDCDTKQLTVRVTSGFAKQIDAFNKATGFFSSRADFCRNALGTYQGEMETIGNAFYAIKEKTRSGFEHQYEAIHALCLAVDKPATPGFGPKSKADTKDWLN